jgi:RNA polymerase sigma factor (sigma-70 family)
MRSDIELIGQLSGADPEPALGEIIQRYGSLVMSTATRTVGSGAADDVCQSVFLVLMRKAANLTGDTVLPSWLYHTTVLVSRQYERGEQRRKLREKEAVKMNLRSTYDVESVLPHGFDDALARLPEIYRRTILLRFLQNHSRADVAKVMGVAENTVDVRTNRGLERLRRALAIAVPGITASFLLIALKSAPAGAAEISAAKAAAISATCLGKSAAPLAVTRAAQATLRAMYLAKVKLIGLAAVLALLIAVGAAAGYTLLKPATTVIAAATPKPKAAPTLPERRLVFRRSIEANDPAGFVWKGIKSPGPEPGTGRVCLEAEHYTDPTTDLMDVYLKNDDGSTLWKYKSDLLLEVELYIAPDAGNLIFSVGNSENQEYHMPLANDLPRSQWTTLKLPLANLHLAPTFQGRAPKDGELFHNLVFSTPKGRFWIDNIKITSAPQTDTNNGSDF